MAASAKLDKDDRAPGATPVNQVFYNNSTALYGRSGSGKTTLAASWPKPILYFNINDNGTDSISDAGEDVHVVHIRTSEDLKTQMLWLHSKAQKGKLKYKTVVFDTLTQLQAILVAEKGVNAKLAKSGKRAGDYGTLTKQDWGEIAGNMKAAILDARNLPVETVFIAQERIFNIGDEGDDGVDVLLPEVGARLSPSVNSDLCASVSIIGNTFIKIKVKKERVKGEMVRTVKKQYCLRLGPNEVYTTKVRKPKGITAPDYIVDPTFKAIMNVVKGKS